MLEALIKSFPMAMGIALSPAPILAIIMLLMTKRAKISAPLFLLGWIIGLQIVGVIIILMPGVIADHGGMSDTTGTVKIIAGIVLLLLIIPIWIKKKKQEGKERIPKLFNNLDEFGVIKVFIIGFTFSALSFKNVALSASGAAHIHTTSLIDYFETLIGVFLFSIIASFTIILPILIYFLAPNKIEILLLKWRSWLIKYNKDILMLMLLVAGIMLVSIGIKIHFIY